MGTGLGSLSPAAAAVAEDRGVVVTVAFCDKAMRSLSDAEESRI